MELGTQEVDHLNLCITNIRNEYPSLYTHHTFAQLSFCYHSIHSYSTLRRDEIHLHLVFAQIPEVDMVRHKLSKLPHMCG